MGLNLVGGFNYYVDNFFFDGFDFVCSKFVGFIFVYLVVVDKVFKGKGCCEVGLGWFCGIVDECEKG